MSSPLIATLLFLTIILHVSAQQALRIYVYDLPHHLSEAVIVGRYQQDWLLRAFEYEADLWVYSKMVHGPWRVYDPAEANLFYIPMLPTRFLHQSLSASVDWMHAVDLCAKYVQEALEIVQRQPYWSLNNGRDHFVTITTDSSRYTHLARLPRSLWGDLRLITHLGDLVLREEGIPCYDPDADILLPAFNPLEKEPLVNVWEHERNVTALYRFGTTSPTAALPYHTRHVRQELRKDYEVNPLEGSDWTVKTKGDTMVDMTYAVFCICPPGIVAHTSRFWRSLRRGCIPVTFFRAFELPFSDVIDYSSAIVNIQPDNVHTMHNTLAAILQDKGRLHGLQQAVDTIQHQLIWEGDNGIWHLLQNELLKRVSPW